MSRQISQEVCPWNGEKFVRLTRERGYLARPGSGSGSGSKRPDSDSAPAALDSGAARLDSDSRRTVPGTSYPVLPDLLAMDEAAWDEFSRGSAIRRARRAGFLRNVAVALGNWGAPEAVPALVRALEDPEPLVRGHAAWALGRIGTAESRAALQVRAAVEMDLWVCEELEAAPGG